MTLGKKPHVLVGCPTHELKSDSLDYFMEGISRLTYDNFDIMIEDNSPTPEYAERIRKHAQKWMEKNPGRIFEVMHSENSSPSARERIVYGRNLIRKKMLEGNYDYFLSLEQDLVPPASVIETLIAREKDIVSATYLNRKNTPHGLRIEIMAGYYHNDEEKVKGIFRDYGFNLILPSRVMKVDYAGLGCVLIARRVLEIISFRVNTNTPHCDDMLFCMDAQKNGFEIFLDSNTWCLHHFNDAFKKTQY